MSYFNAKMHQIRCRLGLSLRPSRGSLQRPHPRWYFLLLSGGDVPPSGCVSIHSYHAVQCGDLLLWQIRPSVSVVVELLAGVQPVNAPAHRLPSAFKTQNISDIVQTSGWYAAAATNPNRDSDDIKPNPIGLISFAQTIRCSQPEMNTQQITCRV